MIPHSRRRPVALFLANYASHIWLGHTLVAMATKIYDFQHKISYNSACAGDTPQMLAPTIGLSRKRLEIGAWSSGSANLMVSVKFCSDDPCCHGNEKLGILPENLP